MNENENIIEISVHGLVDFLLRKGDIDNRIYNSSSMQEGTRIHLRYQQIQNGNYLSEQFLECDFPLENYIFHIEGRADGIIIGGSYPIIDEIKSTVIDLDEFYQSQKDWHLGQAKVYAYMYCKMNSINKIGVRLSYISQKDNDDKLILNFYYSKDELEDFIRYLCIEYLDFYKIIQRNREERNISSNTFSFPFSSFRKGQRELAKYVYGTITKGQNTYIEAPTGIGKTLSTLYPSCKTFDSQKVEKIFYLCAKNVAKNVALDAIKLMMKSGLVVKVCKMQSKERLCRGDLKKCNPDFCPYTKDYYSKLNKVIQKVLIMENIIDEVLINEICDEEMMCPYELMLDLSLYCDIIICDYNYFFDPTIYLKRFFDFENSPYVCLIDEAHNLVERSQEMYSYSLDLLSFKALKYEIRKYKISKLKRMLKRIIAYFEDFYKYHQQIIETNGTFDSLFIQLISDIYAQILSIRQKHPEYDSEKMSTMSLNLLRFMKINEFVSSEFHVYFECLDDNVYARIRCLDSSKLIKQTLDKIKASIFFSATLSPIDYYVSCLGGDESSPKIILQSPFPKENLLTIIRNDISTRYKDRSIYYEEIANTIKEIVESKKGNYLVFFSSYQYIENVMDYINFDQDVKVILQKRDMLEDDRVEFLNNFIENPSLSTVGFAVLGGAFSEGVDLVSSRLIGAIIVGVGLPTVCYERDVIKKYYSSIGKNGYDFAYVYPGMNKVMQAAGRVIRGENDVGLVVFIDDRYTLPKYHYLLKEQYQGEEQVSDIDELVPIIQNFWKKHQY